MHFAKWIRKHLVSETLCKKRFVEVYENIPVENHKYYIYLWYIIFKDRTCMIEIYSILWLPDWLLYIKIYSN